MDVALRAISWIWAFHFFAGASACAGSSFRAAFMRSLYLHGEFVAANVERADINGNHYLTDVFLGVLTAGAAALCAQRLLARARPDVWAFIHVPA